MLITQKKIVVIFVIFAKNGLKFLNLKMKMVTKMRLLACDFGIFFVIIVNDVNDFLLKILILICYFIFYFCYCVCDFVIVNKNSILKYKLGGIYPVGCGV